jgi:hypothetical protein
LTAGTGVLGVGISETADKSARIGIIDALALTHGVEPQHKKPQLDKALDCPLIAVIRLSI